MARGLADAKHNLALISIDEGYAANAARILEEILADIPPGKDAELRGSVLGNLGVAYRDSGNFDAALVALSESVAIHAIAEERISKRSRCALWARRTRRWASSSVPTISAAGTREGGGTWPGAIRDPIGSRDRGLSEGRVRGSARLASAVRRRARPRRWTGRIGRASSYAISSLCGGSTRPSPPVTTCSPVSTRLPLREPMRLSSRPCVLGSRTGGQSRRELRDGARGLRHGANREQAGRSAERSCAGGARTRVISPLPSSSARVLAAHRSSTRRRLRSRASGVLFGSPLRLLREPS